MEFYVIDRGNRFMDDRFAYGEVVDLVTGDFEKCEVCEAPVGMREWLPPRKVRLSKPFYGDFVFGTFSTFLCSENFKEKFIKYGLTGITKFQEVEVVKISKKRPNSPQPPRYYNVKIVRGKGRIDEKLSKVIREEDDKIDCQVCRSGTIESFKGVFLEEGSWGGEDIFFPTGLPGTIVVTQKFYQFVNENGFTNIKFIPAKQYKPSWVIT